VARAPLPARVVLIPARQEVLLRFRRSAAFSTGVFHVEHFVLTDMSVQGSL